jgi:hypothetical protein
VEYFPAYISNYIDTHVSPENKKRVRRTPEQIIADLESKIVAVKTRAASKDAKRTESIKCAISSIRTLDKGMDLAKNDGESKLRHAFADARKVIADYLWAKGITPPKKRMPRGPKPG